MSVVAVGHRICWDVSTVLALGGDWLTVLARSPDVFQRGGLYSGIRTLSPSRLWARPENSSTILRRHAGDFGQSRAAWPELREDYRTLPAALRRILPFAARLPRQHRGDKETFPIDVLLWQLDFGCQQAEVMSCTVELFGEKVMSAVR
jgi:hypothetical protein